MLMEYVRDEKYIEDADGDELSVEFPNFPKFTFPISPFSFL